MQLFFLLLAALILGWYLQYLILKRKIEKKTDTGSHLEEVREEVARVIIELNQTTERNIALIEDRISCLRELLSTADKKIGLLKRESEKHEVSQRVYSKLSARPVVNAAKEENPKKDNQKEILRLHLSGFTPRIIAKRVGLSLGEVELIISLSERKQ
ncbi:MAG: hypothetical protein GH155_03590 [Spirochaeta sp.]|nr:hypothetical protein [Spirochaeta sp.]